MQSNYNIYKLTNKELEPVKDLHSTNWFASGPELSWPSQQNPGFSIKYQQSTQGEKRVRGESKNPYWA